MPNVFQQGWGALFGTGQDPGLFGTGRRDVNGYEVDPNAAQIPGAAAFQAQLAQGAQGAGGRAAPTMQAAQVDPSQQAQFRADQSGLVAGLKAQVAGQGPSLAQGQLRQATDRNLAQALAMASTVGGNNAGALRNVANQRAAISQQAAGDSAQLRLQEQLQAQNQLGQVLAGARGQDIALASQNAQFAQQTGMANQDATLRQSALNDNLVQFYTSQGLSLAQAQQQAALQLQQLNVNQNLGLEGLRNDAYYGTATNRAGFVRDLANAGSRVAGLGAGAGGGGGAGAVAAK